MLSFCVPVYLAIKCSHLALRYSEGLSHKAPKEAYKSADCWAEAEQRRLADEREGAWEEVEMEGEEAAYWVKKDEEKNGTMGRPRRKAGNAIKAGIVGEKFTDNSENEEDSAQPTVGQMASVRYLLTCYTIWRRLWLQGCDRLWQKISDELPLRQYSKWDKGLWRLMTVVRLDEWVPMPCAEDELNTVTEIQAAGLD
jgi:hypothetical protein